VENPNGVHRGVVSTQLDGDLLTGTPTLIALMDDAAEHHVRVILR
jgi:hypothetical protein